MKCKGEISGSCHTALTLHAAGFKCLPAAGAGLPGTHVHAHTYTRTQPRLREASLFSCQ